MAKQPTVGGVRTGGGRFGSAELKKARLAGVDQDHLKELRALRDDALTFVNPETNESQQVLRNIERARKRFAREQAESASPEEGE